MSQFEFPPLERSRTRSKFTQTAEFDPKASFVGWQVNDDSAPKSRYKTARAAANGRSQQMLEASAIVSIITP